MDGKTDKVNYRTKNEGEGITYLCFGNMTDRLTDKVNYILDVHLYRKYSPKILTFYLK